MGGPRRPGIVSREKLGGTLHYRGPSPAWRTAGRLEADTLGTARVVLDSPGPAGWTPGLYEAEVRASGLESFRTGFWVFDPELFASGETLSLDRYTLRKGDVPEPVIATTVMSRSVQRDFLFEPNAAEWDATFAELASLHINLVRTGMWYGWDRIRDPSGAVDEAWLRALEAYHLTARSHGIPVIFTFYAFMPPPADPEESPYFDPHALRRPEPHGLPGTRRGGARHEPAATLTRSAPQKGSIPSMRGARKRREAAATSVPTTANRSTGSR
ncbi:MAG: hypothetical protein R6W82_02800 [bacterium]